MSPKELFAVLLQVLGAWFICTAAVAVLFAIAGPFAHLIVGIVLVLVGRALLSGLLSG